MKRIQLLCSILLISLGISAPAQAGNVTVALTAFMQDSIVETSPDIFEHTAVKVKITQKELLTWLTWIGYSITTGTLAYENGSFVALNLIGPIVPIDTSNLALFRGSPQVKSGIVDVNGEDSEKTKQQFPVWFGVSIDSENDFELQGLSDTTFLAIDGETIKVLNKIALMGTGKIYGKNCTISGKMLLRDSQIAVEP